MFDSSGSALHKIAALEQWYLCRTRNSPVPPDKFNVSFVLHYDNVFGARFLAECDCVCAFMESGDAEEDDFVGSVHLKQLISASVIAGMGFADANVRYVCIGSGAQVLT